MRNLKRLGRWLIHKISVALLANAVAIAVPLLALGIHVTDPQVMKDWLQRTNTYETLINESLNLIELDAGNASSEGSLGDTLGQNPFIDIEAITEALSASLPPGFIQAQAEGFIDGAYDWLDGDTDVPDFEFSLAEKNVELAERLGVAMTEQFNSMPNCLPEEITPVFNLLETLCKPDDVDIGSQVDLLVEELAGDQGLLSGATWTGEDMIQREGEDSGLSPSQVNFAQTAYDGLKNGPLFLIIAGILATPLIYLTSKSQYRGYNEIGNTLFSGSLFTFIPAIIIARWENIITNLVGDTGSTNSTVSAARAIFEPFLEAAVGDIASLTAWISGGVLIVSGLMVGYGFYLKKIYQEQEENQISEAIAEAKETRRIKEVKQHARRRARHKDKTLDPETSRPIHPAKASISKEEAHRIAHDPENKAKKISELK